MKTYGVIGSDMLRGVGAKIVCGTKYVARLFESIFNLACGEERCGGGILGRGQD